MSINLIAEWKQSAWERSNLAHCFLLWPRTFNDWLTAYWKSIIWPVWEGYYEGQQEINRKYLGRE